MKSHRVETSTYNERREHDYESSVRNDAYRARVEIEISEGAVFLVAGEDRQFLCRPAISKRFWYETWLAFKARYSGTPGFDG
jgi:hypothetical protein